MLICKQCWADWSEKGQQWKRKKGKWDYRCSICKSKLKPVDDGITHAAEYNSRYNSLPEYKKTEFKDKLASIRKNMKTCGNNSHGILPDSQIRPDSPTDHLLWAGEYFSEKKPSNIICLGDFSDMQSLCSYDEGKMQFEGRRYKDDVNASINAMKKFTNPIRRSSAYNPKLTMLVGNHENRVNRVVENNSKFEGVISINDLKYEDFGWEVVPFLEIKEIDGVHYSHYFTYELTNNPVSGTMQNRLNKIGFSFIQGHQQVYKVGTKSLANGKVLRGLVCGAFYIEDEEYRGPQSNSEWRGIFILHEVRDGNYSLMEVSLDYLCRRYEKMPIWKFVKKKYPKVYNSSTWMKYQERNNDR